MDEKDLGSNQDYDNNLLKPYDDEIDDKDKNDEKKDKDKKNDEKIKNNDKMKDIMINEDNKNKTENMKSKVFLSGLKNLKKKSPSKFTFLIIGLILGLIFIIILLNIIIKWCKNYIKRRSGYISHIDSVSGKSNQISNSNEI